MELLEHVDLNAEFKIDRTKIYMNNLKAHRPYEMIELYVIRFESNNPNLKAKILAEFIKENTPIIFAIQRCIRT